MLTQLIRFVMLDVFSALRSLFQRQPRERRLSAADTAGAVRELDPTTNTCADPNTCTQPDANVSVPAPFAPLSPESGNGAPSLPWALPQDNASSPASQVVAASLRARAAAQGGTRSLPTAHPWR